MRLLVINLIITLLLTPLLFASTAGNTPVKYMKTNPESYIKIHDYSVYATWSSVAILHNVAFALFM